MSTPNKTLKPNGNLFAQVWEHAGTSGNLFTQFGNTPEPAEISSRKSGMRWNGQKSLRAILECAGTGGNLFTQFGKMPKLAEIVAAQCAAYRVLPCSRSRKSECAPNSAATLPRDSARDLITSATCRRVSVAGNHT